MQWSWNWTILLILRFLPMKDDSIVSNQYHLFMSDQNNVCFSNFLSSFYTGVLVQGWQKKNTDQKWYFLCKFCSIILKNCRWIGEMEKSACWTSNTFLSRKVLWHFSSVGLPTNHHSLFKMAFSWMACIIDVCHIL